MRVLAVAVLLCSLCCANVAADKDGLPTDRPYSIAHRGASGELPEHTIEAYTRAIEQGADFIECDVVLTKDLVPICRHEPDLNDTTDAFEKFPELLTTYNIDGGDVEGIFSVDLTLEEIRTLKAVQTRDFRDPNFDGQFDIPTLAEYIDVALGADRVIGIYPETKHPMWHNSLDIMPDGMRMSDIVLSVLTEKGYAGDVNSESWAKQPVFIQSFEVGNLKYLSGITDLPLVQLLGGWEGYVTPDTNQTHEEITTDEGLDDIATYASGVGPWKDTIIPETPEGNAGQVVDLVERLHARGLQVHPYTFRNEDRFLKWDWGQDAYVELAVFFEERKIDGCFTDFPGSLTQYFEEASLKGVKFDQVQGADNGAGDRKLLRAATLDAGRKVLQAQPEKAGLPDNRPLNIAHRGASGELPEHTIEAYTRAIEQGADFIECDVVLTKDLVPICRHEPDLNDTTDAFEKFPELLTTYNIDGGDVEGIFSVDLTLEEIRTLKAVQTRDFRDPNFDGQFDIPTLAEYIDVALGADRVIGIYPETKHPMWHNSLDIMPDGMRMSDIVLSVLTEKGYAGDVNSESWAKQPVFIQSFEVGNLKYLSGITDLPLVQLLGGWEGYVTPDTNQTHEEITTDEGLDDIATYASGVGPWKDTIIPETEDGYAGEPTDLVERLHDRGLQVHPYTFRNEDRFLIWTWGQDMRREYAEFFQVQGVDGVFTDFPGTLAEYFNYMVLSAA